MSDNFKFVQSQPFTLAGSGAVIGDTTIILKTFAGIDGVLLTMTDFGTIGFGTLSPGNGTLEEQICFTGVTQNANGTATLTGVSSVLFIAPYTKTSGLLKTHAGSTPFIISNTAGFYDSLTGKNDDETINGLWTFIQPPISATDPTTSTQIANKHYVDGVAIAGAPNASSTVKGITELSVDPVSPTVPIAVGDNDTRVPTQGENDALVGSSGTPSSTNVYITNADTGTSVIAGIIVRRLPSTGDIAVPITPGAAGDATSKSYVDGGTYRVYKNILATRDLSTASGIQNIAHGLTGIPKKVKVTVIEGNNNAGISKSMSFGSYDGTTNTCVYYGLNSSGGGFAGSSSTYGIAIFSTETTGTNPQVAVITFDATNVILTWTKVDSPTGTATIMLEVE